MRILKRILIGFSFVLLTWVVGIFIIIRYYEKEVVAYALERINERLVSKAEVASVDLTFWKTFPRASIRFNNVLIRETFAEQDTLFAADQLFLSFHLFDLLSHHYTIKEITADRAKGYFKINESGLDNWHIFKKETTDTTLSDFSLSLKAIMLSDARIMYENRKEKLFLDLTADKAKAAGNFQQTQFDLRLDLAGRLHSLVNGKTEYSPEREIDISAVCHADTQHNHYAIQKAKVEFNGLLTDVSGDITLTDPPRISLAITGQKLALQKMIAVLPDTLTQPLKGYDPHGEISFHLSLEQGIEKKKHSHLQLTLHLSDGSLKHEASGISIKNIASIVHYSNAGGKDKLAIQTMSGRLAGGEITLSGYVADLQKNADANLTLDAAIQLNDWRKFMALDTLAVCDGELQLQTTISGPLGKIYRSASSDWSLLSISGNAHITNGRLALKSSSREFSNVSATLLFNRSEASLQQLTGEVNGSDFRINGTATNLFPFLLSKKESMHIEATLHAQTVDFTRLIEQSGGDKNDDFKFSLPDRIDFRLNTSIDHFRFKKFDAWDVLGITTYKNNQLSISPVSFRTADGDFLSQITVSPLSQEMYQVHCFATLSGINIQKLFAEFGNFGQDFITDQHIRGIARAQVTFSAPLSRAFHIQPDQVKSLIDISIENGELIHLAALQELGSYIRKNKWIAPFINENKFSEKLKNIKFSTLENTIEVSHATIVLPQMDIRSSAMDITIRGKHTFDNTIDYSLGFSLRDILLQRENKWNEADDGLGKKLYLFMRGSTAHPEFGLDKAMSHEARRQEMAVEKQNIKALLKEEMGWFKKDSRVGTYQSNDAPPETTTTIQWEELDKPDSGMPTSKEDISPPAKKKGEEPSEKNTTPPSGKKIPKWLQEKEVKEDAEP